MSVMLTKLLDYVYQCLIVAGVSHCVSVDEAGAVSHPNGSDPGSGGIS